MVVEKKNLMLSVPDVAEMLHVHPNTLRRWSDEGRITAYRISSRGDRRYLPADVQQFLDKMNATDGHSVGQPA